MSPPTLVTRDNDLRLGEERSVRSFEIFFFSHYSYCFTLMFVFEKKALSLEADRCWSGFIYCRLAVSRILWDNILHLCACMEPSLSAAGLRSADA